MATSLLTTKLYIPPSRPNLVPRPRLIERLDEGLGMSHRLTLISAPAGFGKTTLVTEWICGSAREVAWLSLDEEDNDPVRFLNYLIAALQQIDGRIGQTVHQILQSPQLPPPQSLITSLINDISSVAVALTLVLDDYHLVTSTSVHQLLDFLLENQPPLMHVVISTREDPPLPLLRLRARGQVTEIRGRGLRFTAAEAAAFLNQTMNLSLSPAAVQALEARTEGWIAGLQLAALALQEKQTDAGTFIAAFTGDDRHVMDYLIAEVLQRQSEKMRDFLRQTAILDRLAASLCAAVTGQKDSQAMLDQLEGANLLLPLDHRREWYRYHRLFAESLRATLDQEEQKRLHQKAMHWYETHGFMHQAIQHALAYASAFRDPSAPDGTSASGQALEDAERLIQLAIEETMLGGGVFTVRAWLDALPDERVRANGKLAIYKGWVLTLTGESALAEDYIKAAETSLRQAEAPALELGKLLTLRSFITVLLYQDYEKAIELVTDALQTLPEDQSHWRVIALWAMAESLERTTNIAEAIAAFREARRTGLALDNQIFVATVEISLALALNNYGRRREAVALCEEAIKRYTDELGRPSPLAGLIFSRLGMLSYEADQLELAREHHEQALALNEQLGLEYDLTFSQGLAAPTLHVQGKTEAALAALQKARQIASQTGYVDADWFLALEVNIRLQQGDLPFALRWAETTGLSLDDTPQYLRMEQHLIYGRLLLAQDRLADARRWLARLERFTRERGLYRWLITTHVLQALTAERSRERAAARELLSRALEIAAPQDYFRAFLDEDRQIFTLLRDVQHVAPSFVRQLLDYAEVSEPRQDIPTQPLVEPLSERELEVLRLIAAGLSNAEIAQELVITVGTVKRHINHIYGKLDVRSRTQAIAKARELRLLDTDA
jgi:LuxR family maltose regulon positive regulatory protein